MQKVYLLLRSNKQTGPYSLEELIQFNLKPFDLVWVDGRSAAWQYPFEIPALKPYVPETPQAEIPFKPIATSALEENKLQEQNTPSPGQEYPKKVFVSVPKSYKSQSGQQPHSGETLSGEYNPYMPQANQDKRIEETKPESPSYSRPLPVHDKQKPAEEDVHTNYTRSLDDVEQDYTNWMYTQKTKKKSTVNTKELVLAGILLLIIGGGYYVMSKPSVANSVLPANKIATQAEQPAQKKMAASSEQEAVVPDPQIVTITDPRVKQTQSVTPKNPVSVSKNQTNSSLPTTQNSMPGEKTSNIPYENQEVTATDPQQKKQPTVESRPEKKKKLGEVLKGIFSKKEKTEEVSDDKEVVLEDPKPADNRQATRREDNGGAADEKAEETNVAALAGQIDVSSNAAENWMMGIKNLKITLRNRSNTTLQTASVTVHYYDENNKLLDKKLVYFNNVAPKAKATVAAPDHKWADHVEFKLTTVSAKEDRYASY